MLSEASGLRKAVARPNRMLKKENQATEAQSHKENTDQK
jgi:hypothetical protein